MDGFVVLGGGSKGKMPMDAEKKESGDESDGKGYEVSDAQKTAAASVREALKGSDDEKLAKALVSLIKSCEE